MYIIEINGQYVQDISNGMPRFVFGKFGARQFYSEREARNYANMNGYYGFMNVVSAY
ncbi:hypothetical protein [Weissella confusa]|uniref:Uncharacterized protein n=1 Tax=Weissella confusa TaxID=1583 RepID=A0AAJ2YY47_WEICO|nr:hypothetical protein [Weissella confusa]NBA12085.1 hypothetical protein [Weissella confusa]